MPGADHAAFTLLAVRAKGLWEADNLWSSRGGKTGHNVLEAETGHIVS